MPSKLCTNFPALRRLFEPNLPADPVSPLPPLRVFRTSGSNRITLQIWDTGVFSAVIIPFLSLRFFRCVGENFSRNFSVFVRSAGQERYRSLAPMYYRGAEAAIVVYDITMSGSLNSARDWVQEITSDGDEPLVVCLVGNKHDLSDSRAVPEEDAAQYVKFLDKISSPVASLRESQQSRFARYARSIGAGFYEVSAKNNFNIDAVFIEVARRLIDKKVGGGLPRPSVPSGSAIFTDLKKKESTNCCS